MIINIEKYSKINELKEIGDIPNKSVKIGSFTYVNNATIIGWASRGHNIGNISTFPFGYHAYHLTNKVEFRNRAMSQVFQCKNNTEIGNDVWIDYNVTIKCGVKIGDGCIIYANSNITKDIPPYSIVIGNPGIIVKKRYCDEIIEKLLKIQWWNWSEEKIKENKTFFTEKTIDEFIEKFDF